MKFLFATAAIAVATQAAAHVTSYDEEQYEGRSFKTERRVGDLARTRMNDRASSIEVIGQRWEACENTRLGGHCVDSAYVPMPEVVQDNNPVQATPAYGDVTYTFRGEEHRIQTAAPPRATVLVNRMGEPRT